MGTMLAGSKVTPLSSYAYPLQFVAVHHNSPASDAQPLEAGSDRPNQKDTSPPVDRPVYYRCKRVFDLLLSMLALGLLCPLMLLIATAIMLDSAGPVFTVQERVGVRRRRFNGKLQWVQGCFPAYRFRTTTMPVAVTQPGQSTTWPQTEPLLANDRTRVGQFLRRTNLDELPQLWNVVRGDLSLVGPRPALPADAQHYSAWQKRRLATIQGMTGLWQLRAHATADGSLDFQQMVQLDIDYIEQQSFGLDLKILIGALPSIWRAR